MSSPVLAPEISKKEFNWKRAFIKAAGFGAGLALMLAIVAGVGIWYMNRPKPPKPWQEGVITSEFYDLEFGGKHVPEKAMTANYFVTNNSERDYWLWKNSTVMVKVPNSSGLEQIQEIQLTDDFYIPSKQKVRVSFQLPFEKEDIFDQLAAKGEEGKISELVLKELKDTDGFVVFDTGNRYVIRFVNGWREGLKKNLRQ